MIPLNGAVKSSGVQSIGIRPARMRWGIACVVDVSGGMRSASPQGLSQAIRAPEGTERSSRNAYAGEWFHEVMEKLVENVEAALSAFGLQRLPKGTLPDMGRTRAHPQGRDFR